MDISFQDSEATFPFEYFCRDCGQLRLCYVKSGRCGNCGGTDLLIGRINELDKDKLKEEWGNDKTTVGYNKRKGELKQPFERDPR